MTKTGLQGLREKWNSDEWTGPGPAIHPPSQTVTHPILSQHRGAAKFPFGKATLAPLHAAGPDGGIPGAEERKWGTGGQLGPGAGAKYSSMAPLHTRKKANSRWIGMAGRHHMHIPEWGGGEQPGKYAEHSGKGPASRYGMSAGYDLGPGPGARARFSRGKDNGVAGL